MPSGATVAADKSIPSTSATSRRHEETTRSVSVHHHAAGIAAIDVVGCVEENVERLALPTFRRDAPSR